MPAELYRLLAKDTPLPLTARSKSWAAFIAVEEATKSPEYRYKRISTGKPTEGSFAFGCARIPTMPLGMEVHARYSAPYHER